MGLIETYRNWPKQYWDPTEYAGPRLKNLALGRFVVDGKRSYLYERYVTNVVRLDGGKTFLVVPLGGIEGKLIDVADKDQPMQWEGGFDHARYQAILRLGSLREWWVAHDSPEEVRWLHTDAEGKMLSVERFLNDPTAHDPVDFDPQRIG